MPEFSTLTSWEAPDPNFWVPAGYTVVNLNLPGYANSVGRAELMSRRQGEDYYAAIKWVAAQDWCNGSVGLSGVSYLAISQYHAAVAAAKDGQALATEVHFTVGRALGSLSGSDLPGWCRRFALPKLLVAS